MYLLTIKYGKKRIATDDGGVPIQWSTVAGIVDYFDVAVARGRQGLYKVQFLQLSAPAIITMSLSLLYAASAV